ncbi:MAG TPA: glutamine-hydrolyzing GMP synthase, partial [Patescibacteria group bacterium]|nr:glutamine-hydrolyzing GMP synthase [Patescibacteria group bacterium]
PDFKKLKIKKATLTNDRLDLLRRVDDLIMSEIRSAGLYDKIWQFPVVLAPLTIKGGETIILRPVESREAMTVNFYPIPKLILSRLTKKISAISGVDAVFYDITNKPPGTIEWE